MLVQPDQQSAKQSNMSNSTSSSVKLRRKNRETALTEGEKKRNRFSGGDFLLGSPARHVTNFHHHHNQRPHLQNPQMLNQNAELMRKSGDWSYVSFPNQGGIRSPPVTPKMNVKRPLSLMQQHQPISLLETKVMASIIHNENKRGHKSVEVSFFHTKLWLC